MTEVVITLALLGLVGAFAVLAWCLIHLGRLVVDAFNDRFRDRGPK